MNVIELCKTHINPDADWGEIHKFMRNFDIGAPKVRHPDDDLQRKIQDYELQKTEIAKQFILQNSKLKL